jgi:NAD(P)H-hydrate epimerase
MEVITDVPKLPARAANSHKGTYGRVLIVAGSRGMSGAAVLSGMGALRGGAGLVHVASPAEIIPPIAAYNPCYLTAPLPADANGILSEAAEEAILELAGKSDVVALGPGLGQSDAIPRLVKAVLSRVDRPTIVDADGINALAKLWTTKPRADKQFPTRPLILTPHPGEFARLLHLGTDTIGERREDLALAFAAERKLVLVLKGHGTLVTDGTRLYRNATGNPGMATGGTGDVLTGIIAALIGQGMPAFEAAQLGVHWHGLAGDLAAKARGEAGLIATDLLDHLGAAELRLRQT